MAELIYPELSFKVVGLCFVVHNELGIYAKEKQYADLLEQKLVQTKLPYTREQSIGGSGNIVDFITSTKQKTLYDGKNHNFSVPSDDSYSERVGFTYFSLNSNDIHELKKELLTLCQLRKYKSKGDVWIGFGSLKDSKNMIDAVVFNDQTWEYDMKLEAAAKIFLRI